MRYLTLGIAGIAAVGIAASAAAHHTHAMFDQEVSVEMEGIVAAFDWTNPHSWLHITVESDEAEAQRWSLEMGALGGLARRGLRPSSFQPGDNVSVVLHPLKDGSPGGELLSVTLANGDRIDNL